MGPEFWGVFQAVFNDLMTNTPAHHHAAPVQQREPLHGKELSVTFQVIIPTAPEGFSNARIAATQVCTYAPGRGRTLQDRGTITERELEATRNLLLAEGERVRRGLSTGSYLTAARVGAATSRSRR